MLKKLLKYQRGDKVIWMVAIVFALFSIPSVYSYIIVPAIHSTGGNTEYFLFKHSLLLCTGFVLMYYAHLINFRYYSRISQISIWIAGILLFLTLIFGSSTNNATRWFLGFQPSDFAKLVLVIYVARKLAQNQSFIKNFKDGVLPIIVPVVIICGLILPANFSTAAMLFCVCMVIMFVGRVAIKHLLAIVGGVTVVFGLILLIALAKPQLLPRLDTWVHRIENFSEHNDNSDTYQADMAKVVIANGGFPGMGPGNGKAKNILPLAWADFIYASVIEEYGSILGGIGLILLYLILLYRGIRVSSRCDKPFGTFLAAGLSIMIVFQAMINMAVAVNLLPVTGQSLPLMSMGGTSLWFTCIAIGIILSVSRTIYPENENKQQKNTAIA